jgi:ABC-2 type transport system ATP-binding protein
VTASPDDGSDRPDDATAAPVDGSAKKPPAKRPTAKPQAAAKSKAPGAKSTTPAAKSKTTAAKPRAAAGTSAATRTAAEKAAAVKSGQARAAAAKTEAARTTAAKTAAAKAAATRAAAAKTAAKTATAKATAARAAAARTAAAEAAATKAAAAKAAAEAEEAEKSRAATAAETSEQTNALDASATGTASRTPAAKRETTKKAAPRTTKKAAPPTKKPRAAKPTTRPRPVVAADAAAPTGEAIASPTGEVEIPSKDAVAEDALFADLLSLEPTDSESVTEAEIVEASADPTVEPAVVEPAASEPAVVEPAVSEPAESDSAEPAQVEDPVDIESDAAPQAVAPDGVVAVAAAVDVTAAQPESAPHAVILRDLVKDFGDQRAVDGIDLTVPAGSFYGIVGPNGAGKTTTLSILAGLLRATSGQVVVCGIDQATDPLSTKRVMGVLPDRLRTFDRLTGRQLLHYYGLLRGLAAEVIEKRTADLARAFDLADALNRVVSDYSAGMTKKIMLAGAMIHSPRVLVLDEPFEAVDPVSSAVILDILRAYVAHGGTVILSSHGMDLVERVCSRVAIIVGGEVLAEGTIDEVRAGQTLESRFVELSGGVGEVEGLEWLHAFSD